MPRIDSEKFYISTIKTYGLAPQGLGWHSKESQELRFDILLEMLPKDLSDISVADAGCGFGDFYLYMLKKGVKPQKYIGIDSLESMCKITAKQTGSEVIVADICKEELPAADYYVCSGAMNILNNFETHLFMRNCYHACKNAFIFNVLHGDIVSQTYNYLTTKQIQKIAKELKVWHVEMKSGYFENDITVAFLKDWE